MFFIIKFITTLTRPVAFMPRILTISIEILSRPQIKADYKSFDGTKPLKTSSMIR